MPLASQTARRDAVFHPGLTKNRPHARQRDVAKVIKQSAKTDQETKIADAINDERLHRRIRGRLLLIPEADQQIAAEAHQFPEDEKLKKRPAEHQAEHRKTEQAKVGEESRKALVLGHVADGKDVNQRGDQRDHREHRDGQAIDEDADVEKPGMGLIDPAADGNPRHRDVDRRFLESPLLIEIFPAVVPGDHRADAARKRRVKSSTCRPTPPAASPCACPRIAESRSLRAAKAWRGEVVGRVLALRLSLVSSAWASRF